MSMDKRNHASIKQVTIEENGRPVLYDVVSAEENGRGAWHLGAEHPDGNHHTLTVTLHLKRNCDGAD